VSSSQQVSSRAAAGVAAVALAAALAGCSGGIAPAAGERSSTARPSPSVAPVAFTVTPDDDAARVRLDEKVSVKASNGTLTAVSVRARDGKALKGALAEDGSGWTSSKPLAPGTTYTVTAQARDGSGGASNTTSSFRTLKPRRTVGVSVQPGGGWTVGVGMPVIVSFDRAVADRARAERALTVRSSPAVTGDWRWFSDQQVQWRPKKYWPSGTRVTVEAALKGVELAPGTWGAKNSATSFRVGSAMISTVDTARHTLTVRRNGRVIRTIPVTTGKPGFQTRNGTKVIMSRETSRRMDAATTGTDPEDPEYYNLLVRYAMRLTHSGEFLHAAPWSVGSQGRANVSHGCTGMSTANARWLFAHSKVGDVVVYTGSSRRLEWGNGITAWEMSYRQWRS
jgi:lipoprotein-anchoring transpeptidase ErfK/SrfK